MLLAAVSGIVPQRRPVIHAASDGFCGGEEPLSRQEPLLPHPNILLKKLLQPTLGELFKDRLIVLFKKLLYMLAAH